MIHTKLVGFLWYAWITLDDGTLLSAHATTRRRALRRLARKIEAQG